MVGSIALPLGLAGPAGGAPPKALPPKASPPTTVRAAPDAGAGWVADELRILRSDIEALKQRSETSVTADLSALRNEVSRLAAAQADIERRLGGAPTAEQPLAPMVGGGGTGVAGAIAFLLLGAGLGWVGSRLTQRWRDRRQRIRV